MSDFTYARDFLQASAARWAAVKAWTDWLSFRAASRNRQWLYLYRFAPSVFAWGTTTGNSDRLRRACMFNPQLTGKYDRRVDYLMLKVIEGAPDAWVFECREGDDATDIEGALRDRFEQAHCYRGFRGTNRKDISREIHSAFQDTQHYRDLPSATRRHFEQFMTEVFYGFRKHPKNPKQTFYWGDCLEPGFLHTLDLGHLEHAVEAALLVKFPRRKAK